MAISYPEGFDTFSEPDMPEETPLSGAGSGSRNHVQHHKDLGDAVEALQRNVSLLSHDHSGGAGDLDTSKLIQANTHEEADTDTGLTSIHHTLGTGEYQAAPGNHVHDYDSGTILNKPLVRCLSTNRPANPTLGLQIYETDTNRVRVWAQFTGSNIANTGVYSGDDFERSNSNDMGPDWEQTYVIAGDHGILATPDGHNLAWIDQGDDPGRCIARRIKPSDATTSTDDQIIVWQLGGTIGEQLFPWLNTPATNDMYFRMSADGQSYLRAAFTYSEWGQGSVVIYGTKTGPAGEVRIGSLAANTRQAWSYWTGELIGSTLSIYNGSNFIGKVTDANSVTNRGANYRGWGVGMSAGDKVLPLNQQVTPSNVASVIIKDATYYTGSPLWQILPVGAIPTCRLRQSTAQKLNSTGSVIEWQEELDDNFNFFNATASKTDIVIKEPGLYHVDAAIQWDPQVVPDVATAVLAINGTDTSFRQQQFMRGNLFSPGFSQTLSVSGKVRFAQNDILNLKASFQASGSIINQIFSWFDSSSRVQSRIEVFFLGP